MSEYNTIIREYLAAHEPDYGGADISTLLEMLRRCYTESNPIDNAVLRGYFMGLEEILEKLTLEENDRVFCTVCNICDETERLAFMEGFRVGLRLTGELAEVLS